MKGKGKAVQDKDCPLMYPDLEPVDHVKQCPRYTASKYSYGIVFKLINVCSLVAQSDIQNQKSILYMHEYYNVNVGKCGKLKLMACININQQIF